MRRFLEYNFVVLVPIPPPPIIKTDFPRPDIVVNCLADGVSVTVALRDPNFHGIMYVKGHSQDQNCRRSVEPGEASEPVDFSVKFDTCGLFHFQVRHFHCFVFLEFEKKQV